MTNTYRISSSDLRIEDVKTVLASLYKAFKELDIEFYVIGALARDIMAIIHDEKPIRATQDIDLAVLVGGENNYNTLKAYLISKENFTSDKSLIYRLFKNETIIDLIPFGEIEKDQNAVTLRGVGELVTLNTFGLKEVYKSAVEVTIDNDFQLTVSTFPGICILKLIAYSDRPDYRAKDVSDIKFIIEKYADMNIEYISNEHYDLMNNPWDLNLSARILGRDMGKIMRHDKVLKDLILDILNSNIDDNHNSKIALMMTSGIDKTLEESIEILRSLRDGIKDIT